MTTTSRSSMRGCLLTDVNCQSIKQTNPICQHMIPTRSSPVSVHCPWLIGLIRLQYAFCPEFVQNKCPCSTISNSIQTKHTGVELAEGGAGRIYCDGKPARGGAMAPSCNLQEASWPGWELRDLGPWILDGTRIQWTGERARLAFFVVHTHSHTSSTTPVFHFGVNGP